MTQEQKNERLADKKDYLTALYDRREVNSARILEVEEAIRELVEAPVEEAN